MPTQSDSLPYLLRGLALLANRDVQRQYIERIVQRAGVQLSPAAAWALVRVHDNPREDVNSLSHTYHVAPERVDAALREIKERGYVLEQSGTESSPRRYELTSAGCDVFNRLVAARRERLHELFSDVSPEHRDEVAAVLVRLLRELVPDARPPLPVAGTR